MFLNIPNAYPLKRPTWLCSFTHSELRILLPRCRTRNEALSPLNESRLVKFSWDDGEDEEGETDAELLRVGCYISPAICNQTKMSHKSTRCLMFLPTSIFHPFFNPTNQEERLSRWIICMYLRVERLLRRPHLATNQYHNLLFSILSNKRMTLSVLRTFSVTRNLW